nr:putative capsid [Marmot picobirnavirus]
MAKRNYSNAGNSTKKQGNQRSRGSKWKNKANKQASNRNFQDAAMDMERSKSSEGAIDTGSSDNDPSWYIPTGQMARDVASLPSAYNVGSPVDLKSYTNPASLDPDNNQILVDETQIPGILVYHFVPTFGPTSTDPKSALNIAMNTSFTDIRRATSGTSYYEGPDLMKYYLAMDSAYMYYSWMVRLYGSLQTFSMMNRYLPEGIVSAMGANYKNLERNIALLRTYINIYAYKLSSFPVPKDFNFIIRHIFMCENIYTDAQTLKSQFYMYNPIGFWTWSDDAPDTSWRQIVEYVEAPWANGKSLVGYEDIVEFGDSLIQPLIASEDIRFIAADISKAFGTNTFQVSQIAENYSVIPVFNTEVLMQFENAYIYPSPYDVNGNNKYGEPFFFKIQEDTEVNKGHLQITLEYLPAQVGLQDPLPQQKMTNDSVFYNSNIGSAQYTILNFHFQGNPTPEQVLVASRLSAAASWEFGYIDDIKGWIRITNCGSEVILGATMWCARSSSVVGGPTLPVSQRFSTILPIFLMDYIDNESKSNNSTQILSILSKVSRFDWFPKFRIPCLNQSSQHPADPQYAQIRLSDYIFDIDNYVIVSENELKMMNDMALLGELVPKASSLAH